MLFLQDLAAGSADGADSKADADDPKVKQKAMRQARELRALYNKMVAEASRYIKSLKNDLKWASVASATTMSQLQEHTQKVEDGASEVIKNESKKEKGNKQRQRGERRWR